MNTTDNTQFAESGPVPPLDYGTFLNTKRLEHIPTGKTVEIEDVNGSLFEFQRALVKWALMKGRAALFADTGLGKTRMQLAWGELLQVPTLILAPLAVAKQTVAEGARIGVPVTYARSQAGASATGITITNYEMLHAFDPSKWPAVVLDESSILKSFESKTRSHLIKAFSDTPFKLCCTATPAPNDISEIANHAEFLGLMIRTEMLAAFFVHDDSGWRLKGHADRGPFWRWMASWAMSVRRPGDIGFPDDGYDLPLLSIRPVIIESDWTPPGKLFHDRLQGVSERAMVRAKTAGDRVENAAHLINTHPGEPFLAWVGLNDEGRMLHRQVPGSVLVEGSQSPEQKAGALEAFAAGEVRVLITKPSIAGFGMNFQHCSKMVFVGLGDSYEQYYQAIRRCYRFGQQRPVEVYIVLSEVERPIFDNVLGKEKEAKRMASALVEHVAEYERMEIGKGQRERDTMHAAKALAMPEWLTKGHKAA